MECTNFSQGLPIFSVSIALEHFGSAVVGVVYAPYIDEMFYAIKDGGSYLNGKKYVVRLKRRFLNALSLPVCLMTRMKIRITI